ncbi:DUF5715 family protein [Prevotella sp. E15-22]|uniref:DUF5715 family protein n=1 Tax=Prevotella sp. E15-22 TaxID=2937774 RepID=UPI0020672A06|nr:DUF5715 family protein [Prevotella sp. E15-22]UPS43692.1 DUF5715 family protein [Prevotella sp. E15-22]
MDKELRKHRFVEAFGIVVIVLALVRCAFPDISTQKSETAEVLDSIAVEAASVEVEPVETEPIEAEPVEVVPAEATRYVADGERFHRIKSVPSYKNAFPDNNDVQLTAANRWGVKPVKNRRDAELRKNELVYIDCSPYYYIDPLYSSIPYLTPRAAILLQDIGQAFFDSLQVKGVPLHRFIVTSVLRTQDDVVKLRRHNGNATENSCHLYGTTIDICYNRYKTVEDPDGPSRRQVRNDSLKYILSEVLNDMRQQNRCYVKYEVKQGCFHMTVR